MWAAPFRREPLRTSLPIASARISISAASMSSSRLRALSESKLSITAMWRVRSLKVRVPWTIPTISVISGEYLLLTGRAEVAQYLMIRSLTPNRRLSAVFQRFPNKIRPSVMTSRADRGSN